MDNIKTQDESLYPQSIIDLVKSAEHFGKMNDPVSSAWIKGPCGEEMEFYLVIKDGIVKETKFFAEGCIATRACGQITAGLAINKSIDEVLTISPAKVISLLEGLPKEGIHCAILAVSTLYKAIADYLLKP